MWDAKLVADTVYFYIQKLKINNVSMCFDFQMCYLYIFCSNNHL